jgi:hypothetical protein
VVRASIGASIAFGSLFLLAMFLPIGLMLWFGEWIFGSMGWGILHGTLMLIGSTVLPILVVLGFPARKLLIDLVIATVVGVIVSIVLGLALPNQLFAQLGETVNLGLDPVWQPILVGAVLIAIVGAVVGLVAGAMGGGGGAAVGGLIGGAIVGALLGVLAAIPYTWQTGIATGIAVGLLVWIILMGVRVAREGVDVDGLKRRFLPQTTIDTTKETFEWLKTRKPQGPTS